MKRIIYFLILLVILSAGFILSCDKENPFTPTITKGVSRTYSSVQLMGGFNNWEISNAANNMIFKGEYVWEKTVVLSAGSYEFKFATGYSWDNDNFGDNETPDSGTAPEVIFGTAELWGGNIILTIDSPGIFLFRFNDKDKSYSVESRGYYPNIINGTVSSISINDSLIFTCNVTDEDGTISWVKVHYWDDAGGTNTEIIETLNISTDDTYISTIKNPNAEGVINYYFEARDDSGNISVYPEDAPITLSSVSVSDQIIIDGVIDSIYGTPLTSDPNTDGGGNDEMDLVDLYVYDDTDNYYILFTIDKDISGASNWGKYAIYIDVDNTNDSGATSDAWGRAVVVNNPHKPEYALYCWVDQTPFYASSDTQLYSWNGSSWTGPTYPVLAALSTGTISIVEYEISKSSLGNPSQIWLEVWSTGNGGTDNARDTINNPSDDWNGTAGDWSSTADLDCSTNYVNKN
ncbi:MAG: hypothetical protein PHV06_05680 [bacterium]|nr:hypothetical protein [bacterium]